MFKSVINSFLNQPIRSNFFKLPLAGLMVMVSTSTANANPVLTNRSQVAAPSHQAQVAQATPTSQTANGVYLYGQSSRRDEIGKEYMVFEVRQGLQRCSEKVMVWAKQLGVEKEWSEMPKA